ncbi:hypothetical protein EPUS_02450 [Endocarpon pusillum Z07020]|uniref:Uncharacterized protein n=2 Tax=Endocarpon pusillum TaxID=364733 RepID=U1G127_ENDPU|nr:uncharacterized protein EPUS_02450 [Endocarpon pusillum Z07020]ERF70927.1 hypothetical protein EPUS_02450 [Endocarpon pusillum Z07020]
MDQPPVVEESARSPLSPDLQMTPEVERELELWRMTGEPPFPELRMTSKSYWHRFSSIDLRLIHHIAGLSIDMHQRGYSGCTVWAQKMPAFLAIALSNDFVLSAVLALSASHLAWQTKNTETEHLAYQHRGVALKGLHEAIGAFARDNSEAILAASMLLSWQAIEWRSWASLQQGVSTVLNAMRPWIHESEIANYIESQRSVAGARTPVTPSFPQTQPRTEDLARLDQATAALHDLRARLANNAELSDLTSRLLLFLQDLRRDFPLQAPEEAFERLQELRQWLFWLPPALFRPGESDLGAMAVLSHFFGVALALDPLFPEIGGSYLGSMSVMPIEDMQRVLLARRAAHPQETGVITALSLMDVPLRTVSSYKAKQHFLAQRPQSYQASPHSPYPASVSQTASSPEAMPRSVYAHSPMQSPGNHPSQGSPYITSGSGSSGARRSSGYFDAVPRASSQPYEDNNYMYNYSGPPLGSSAGYSSGQQRMESHRPPSSGYETSSFQAYGIETGDTSGPRAETELKGKGKQRE